MKKIILFLFINTILISAFSQSGRDQKKANIATEEWRYEINCRGTGGADNSYLLDVVSYLRDDRLSINQSKRMPFTVLFLRVFLVTALAVKQSLP